MRHSPRPPGWYPSTSNQHAAWLIQRARDCCENCRASWRLYGTVHKTGLPKPIECTALDARTLLRRIAFNFRKDQT